MTRSENRTLNGTVTIRGLDERDHRAVKLLAQLDTRAVPEGELIGAEVEGRLLAAASIETGEAIADPFSRTDEMRAMLTLRVAQLRRRGASSRRRLPLVIRRRPSAALAASPPGAGGRLLTLPRL